MFTSEGIDNNTEDDVEEDDINGHVERDVKDKPEKEPDSVPKLVLEAYGPQEIADSSPHPQPVVDLAHHALEQRQAHILIDVSSPVVMVQVIKRENAISVNDQEPQQPREEQLYGVVCYGRYDVS